MVSVCGLVRRVVVSGLVVGSVISTVGVGSVGAAAPDAASAVPDPSLVLPTPSRSDAVEMADMVNQHRRANGVDPVTFDVEFSDRTEPFAISLASKFPPPRPQPEGSYRCPTVNSETGFKHDDSAAIWASTPPGTVVWGENLAYACGPAFDTNLDAAFDSLVESPGHNASMLDSDFTHVGIAVVRYGNSTFVVQRFAEVVAPPQAPTVTATASCLAGMGRIDIDVTNKNARTSRYAVRVTGARGFETTRYLELGAQASGRVTVTGRFDGVHEIGVWPDDEPGFSAVGTSVVIDCAPVGDGLPVSVATSCLGGNGRIDVDIANTTSSSATFIVDVQSGAVSDRGLILSAGEKGRVTVTGRPDGDIPVIVLRGNTVVHSEVVTVSCDD